MSGSFFIGGHFEQSADVPNNVKNYKGLVYGGGGGGS